MEIPIIQIPLGKKTQKQIHNKPQQNTQFFQSFYFGYFYGSYFIYLISLFFSAVYSLTQLIFCSQA